jgi:D-alanyl-D-alanine carboxypeptidase/D-alanyl-D-alanine-endopeptidase (penicillin-binding protein 4)
VALGRDRFCVYYAPSPASFAAIAFARALRDEGVDAAAGTTPPTGGREQVVEHVPVPVSEQLKGMLKISSNIHTVMWPYVVGAVAGRDPETAKATYQARLRELCREAGVDPDAPGVADGRYSSDFFVAFLAHLSGKPYFDPFRDALPVLGVDGSLDDIAPDSPAVGRVFAKTGTGVGRFDPSAPPMVHKALAGYVEQADGRRVAFAEFMEVPVESVPAGQALAKQAGAAMGEIAALVHEATN